MNEIKKIYFLVTIQHTNLYRSNDLLNIIYSFIIFTDPVTLSIYVFKLDYY